MRSIHYIKGAVFSVVSIFAISCTKSELPENLSTAQISFTNSVIENHITKSDASVSIPEFYVFAYHTGEQLFQDYITSGILPVANWMYGQKVERTSENTYTYSPVTYWPINPNEKITFIGYYAQNEENVKVVSPDPITKKGEPKFKYTTKTEDPTGDFLVSQPAYDLTRKNGSVKFYMQHVLSKTRFNIKSTSVNIKIKSIRLKNVYTEAVFTAHSRVWSDLTNRADLKTYTIASSEQDLTDQFRLLSPYYIVIPQQIQNNIIQPTFEFVFEDNGVEKTLEFVPSKDWDIYKSYTYNITYSAGELEVLTDLEAWIENTVEDDIIANQYLNVSTRELDLAYSHHFYYNSSFPTTEVYEIATYADKSSFNLYNFFNVYIEGNKIRLQEREDKPFEAETFTIYLQGHDLHGHAIVRLPINVKAEKGTGIEIDGTFWAPGNIIYHNGHLDIAPNTNYTGLYFRWGSLIGLAGNNSEKFDFIPGRSVGFRPAEFDRAIPKWNEVPYEQTMGGNAYDDAFKNRYDNKLGFDANKALGDPCRYMSNQKEWTKGKWRMPTKNEYEVLVDHRKIRKINGIWVVPNEGQGHISATTGTLPLETGWFVKADMTDNTIPPDNEFNSVKPPKGWVFYPASGKREGNKGMLSNCSTMGYYWTASTTTLDAYRFQFSETNTDDNLGSFSAIAIKSGFVDAYPIRCVRDNNK